MDNKCLNSDKAEVYVKPCIETLQIELEGSVLTASSENINVYDDDF